MKNKTRTLHMRFSNRGVLYFALAALVTLAKVISWLFPKPAAYVGTILLITGAVLGWQFLDELTSQPRPPLPSWYTNSSIIVITGVLAAGIILSWKVWENLLF